MVLDPDTHSFDADIVADPESGVFLTPWIRDSGWVKIRTRIRDPTPG
jgi:hypothetical protein